MSARAMEREVEPEMRHLQLEEGGECRLPEAPPVNRRLRWAGVALTALGVVGVLVCAYSYSYPPEPLLSQPPMIEKVVYAHPPMNADVDGLASSIIEKESQDWSRTEGHGVFEGYNHSFGKKPKAHRHDGNVCRDDEEHFANLCYEKCEILTAGKYPYRCSSWQCGDSFPCSMSLWSGHRTRFGICSGFDVSGSERKSCPHPAGDCLPSEEFFGGQCYKKCSLIDPEYPFRFSSSTCCKTTGLSCLGGRFSRTGQMFDIAGGKEDADPMTPSMPHAPLASLTEKSD